jgi:hypothetical protein
LGKNGIIVLGIGVVGWETGAEEVVLIVVQAFILIGLYIIITAEKMNDGIVVGTGFSTHQTRVDVIMVP